MADDFGSSTTTSGSLTVGSVAIGNIETSGDADWFRVSLTAGRTYRFDLEGADTGVGTLSDPLLLLIDNNNSTIHAIDGNDGIGLNASLTFTPAVSGFYYVDATSANYLGGTYRLSAVDTGLQRLPAIHPAIPSSVPRPLTGDELVDAFTHGYNWQLDNSRTINWATSDGLDGETWQNLSRSEFTFGRILGNISTYANINFNYVGHYTNQPEAYYAGSDITISLDGTFISNLFGGDAVWGLGIFSNSRYNFDLFPGGVRQAGYQGAPGDILINLNSQANSLPTYDPGSAGYAFLIHELGHVLGLKHPFDDGGTGRPTLASLSVGGLDKDRYSVMSYSDDYNYNLRSWDPATPMALDVLALQYLYGPNLTTNAGMSYYSFEQNSQYQTIWDAGGGGEIYLSRAPVGWDITLPIYQPSLVLATKVGLAIPANETSLISPHTLYWLMGDIENITGSAFADRLTGNNLPNLFRGGGGNDIITGRGGFDEAFYSGAGNGYRITNSLDNRIITDLTPGRDGSDTVSDVERLVFGDGVLAFDNLRTDNAGRGYLLYRAAFDRTPDAAGLGYWVRALDGGADYAGVVAASFIASPEFTGKYGVNTGNAAFLNLVYQNVLDRAPDQAGNDYWLGHLNSGYSRANMLASFAVSDENYHSVSPLITDGIWFV
ncbi:MAG: DUF4214 domain-containing protein [Alphaproteobacteria bacterium]